VLIDKVSFQNKCSSQTETIVQTKLQVILCQTFSITNVTARTDEVVMFSCRMNVRKNYKLFVLT